MLKAVIFDFDGTIADTMSLIVDIGNLLADEFGFKRVNNPASYRDKTIPELLKEFNIPFYKVTLIARRLRRELNKRVGEVQLFKGMDTVIKKVRQTCLVGILTSNAKGIVEDVLGKHGVSVDFIYSRSPLFAKHHGIAKILKHFRLRRDKVVYVGDEVRDIQACKRAGIRIISVTWGFNSRRILNEHNLSGLVDSPRELLKKIAAL